MGKRFITSSQFSISKARALRQKMTVAERKFWSLVRGNRLGVKFRRQVPIGTYIVDFFCFSAKLVVELDGSQHYRAEGKEYDFHRDEYLGAHGLTVVRFSNKEFLANQDGVISVIRERVRDKKA
jgi:very-short-patch-repair endonuclease